MSTRQINIAVDAMGGENSPFKVLKGAEIFQKENTDTLITLFGDEKIIKSQLKINSINLRNYKIENTSDNVMDDDNANTILRSRKNLLALSKFSLPILIAKIFILSNSGLA